MPVISSRFQREDRTHGQRNQPSNFIIAESSERGSRPVDNVGHSRSARGGFGERPPDPTVDLRCLGDIIIINFSTILENDEKKYCDCRYMNSLRGRSPDWPSGAQKRALFEKLPYGATTLSQHCPLMAFGLLIINSDFSNQPEM